MADLCVQRKLEELLASPAAATRSVGAGCELTEEAIVLYGAGTLGRATLKALREEGLEPAAFADETPGKEGTLVEGVPVMTPRAAAERFGERAVFIVTILNSRLSFLDARRRLKSHGCARVLSFFDLARQYPRALLPHYNYQPSEDVLSQAAEIRRAFGLWADAESRRQFAAHIEFQLSADYGALPPPSGDNYFPDDVPLPLTDDTIFVDCGAYDGDTVRHFLARCRGKFREIFAFEPDPDNCRRLRQFVTTLEIGIGRRIHILSAGVGSRPGRLNFQASGDMGASFGGVGGMQVEVLPLDEVIVADAGTSAYVKYDVEGAEMDALSGTRQLISRAHPALAVSVYHRPGDLWKIPLYLASLDAGYRLFLRTQGVDGMDVICYAIPSEHSAEAE